MIALSAYFITDLANAIQVNILSIDEVPTAYKIIFKINNITALFIPILICSFLFITSKYMLCDVFDKQIDLQAFFCAICFSLIPLLLYDYFFWFNLIEYAATAKLSTVTDFLNLKYAFGITLKDFDLINTCCWIYLYIHLAVYFIKRKISIYVTLMSILLPSTVVFLMLRFI